jgi:hypothetical protein
VIRAARTIRFLVVALAVYAGFLLLWAPAAGIWGDGYRCALQAALGRFGPGVQVRFAPHATPTRYVDTEVVITSERAPQIEAFTETGSLVGTYLPTALLVSLVVASPLPGRRKLRALVLGLLALQLVTLALTALTLLDHLADHPELRPFAVPGVLRPALHTLVAAVRGHFYPMLVLTCAIWMLVGGGIPAPRSRRISAAPR